MVGARTVYGLRYIAPQLKIPQSSTAAHMLRGRGVKMPDQNRGLTTG
jgi:hypothetical protein